MNKTRVKILEDMLIHKERIKSEDSSLRVDCTSDGLRASITAIESNKLEQATKTENLIDNEWEQGGIDDITGKKFDAIDRIRGKNFLKVYPGHLYKISRNVYTNFMYFRFYDKNYNYVGNQATDGMVETNITSNRMNANQDNMEMTILNEDVAYMKIADASNDLSTIYTMTTEAINIDYSSPIEGVTGNINLKIRNGNYFNKNDSNIVEGYRLIDDGSLFAQDGYFTSDYILVMPNTKFFTNYTISVMSRICEFDKNKNFIKVNKDNLKNFTTSSETKFVRLCGSIDGDEFSSMQTMMLTLKEMNLDYIACKEQNFTISLKDKVLYKGDKFIRKNGKHWIHNKYKRRIFDGTEEWSLQGINEFGIANFMLSSKLDYVYIPTTTTAYMTNFSQQGSLIANTQNEGFLINDIDVLYIRINSSVVDTVEKLKSWLSENNQEFIYLAKTPTDTEITDETLIAQLDKILYYIREYDDITNIVFDNDVTFEITVEKNKLSILEQRLDKSEQNTTSAQMLALESED